MLGTAGCATSAPWERDAAALERMARAPAASPTPDPAVADPAADDPLASVTLLTPELASAIALARNPRLDSARAAIRAAAAEVRSAGGGTDPRFEYMLAPGSIGSEIGQSMTVRWAFPWPGTPAARAARALADAQVEALGLDVMRRDLAEQAAVAVHSLGTLAAARALIATHHQLMDRLRASLPEVAMAADAAVDIASQDLTTIELARSERLLTITLNTLLHRAPGLALPPTPALDAPPAPPEPLPALLAAAAEHRPEVRVALARVEASRRAVTATQQENKPMIELGAGLDTMWPDAAMWPRIMVMVELPFERARRAGAEDAARARVAAAQADLLVAEDEAVADIATRREELAATLESLAQLDKVVAVAEARQALVAARGLPGAVAATSALLDLRMRRLDLLRDAWIADARLASAIGGAP
ncbi:MAG: TolC family protein [Myxococcota bacterium]